jgi:hypothetical protein
MGSLMCCLGRRLLRRVCCSRLVGGGGLLGCEREKRVISRGRRRRFEQSNGNG